MTTSTIPRKVISILATLAVILVLLVLLSVSRLWFTGGLALAYGGQILLDKDHRNMFPKLLVLVMCVAAFVIQLIPHETDSLIPVVVALCALVLLVPFTMRDSHAKTLPPEERLVKEKHTSNLRRFVIIFLLIILGWLSGTTLFFYVIKL